MAKSTVNQSSISSFEGLKTNINTLAGTNSLAVADNIILSKQGAPQPRHGFGVWASPEYSALSFMEYNNTIYWHDTNNKINYSTGEDSYSTIPGTYYNVTNASMRGSELRGNFYIATQNGIKVLNQSNSELYSAGMPAGLDIVLSSTGNGWFPGSSQIDYKITWLREDSNGYIKRGRPSVPSRLVNNNKVAATAISFSTTTATVLVASHTFVENDVITMEGTGLPYPGDYSIFDVTPTSFKYTMPSTTTATPTSVYCSKKTNIDIVFNIPQDIVSGDQFEIWRTEYSADAYTVPYQNYYLVHRGTYSSGSTLSYNDITSQAYLSPTPLYTNSNFEGADKENSIPPLAADICKFKNHMFYANTQLNHQLSLKLISVTGDLVDNTSYIKLSNGTINETYTFSTDVNYSLKKFKRYTNSTASVNIVNTVKSLINVINRTSEFFYAEYISGENDDPGMFRVWVRNFDFGQFYIDADNLTTGDNFIPVLKTDHSVVSDNDHRINRLYFSKIYEPEAVPVLQYIDIGDQSKQIYRIIDLTNSLVIIKEDGVYYLTGETYADFQVRLLDKTYCTNADTVVKLSNKIYMLSNKGIVEINDSSVSIISMEIDNVIKQILNYSNTKNLATGISYEMENQYILWLPSSANDTVCTQAFVYDLGSMGYSRWVKKVITGYVDNQNRLFLSVPQNNAILKYRNLDNNSDYRDETIDITINSVSDNLMSITYDYDEPFTVGFSIRQPNPNPLKIESFAKVISFTKTGNTTYDLVLDRKSTFTTGSAYADLPIYVKVELHPNTCGDSTMSKTFTDLQFAFEYNNISKAKIYIISNQNGSKYNIDHERVSLEGWGVSPWGSVFGNYGKRSINIRENIPMGHSTCESLVIGFEHNVSYERFILCGSSLTYNSPTTITEGKSRR